MVFMLHLKELDLETFILVSVLQYLENVNKNEDENEDNKMCVSNIGSACGCMYYRHA